MTTEDKQAERTSPDTYLFLQGPSSPLFARIADRLEALGHACLRVNICAGDWVFWRRPNAENFRRGIDAWPAYIVSLIERRGVTAIVLLGEERPHHAIAARLARARGIPVYTIEMGYLRPDWIKIERDGSGFRSHFPADPDAILEAAKGLPEPDFRSRYFYTFATDAVYDLMYNLPNVFLAPLYPGYRRHAIHHPLAEYGSWIRRLLGSKKRAREAQRVLQALRSSRAGYFLLPLQLETDYQIRAYSDFASQRDVIRLVVASFAAHAPVGSRLLIKLHPLDNGLIDWKAEADTASREAAVQDRVHFVDGGYLNELIDASDGMITINSTVGIVGLQSHKPVKVLGVAIYDTPRLTSSLPLDQFWTGAVPPDAALVDAFIRLLAASLHVRGNFYSKAGIEAGAAALAQRLHDGSAKEPPGYVAVPPRARPAGKPQGFVVSGL